MSHPPVSKKSVSEPSKREVLLPNSLPIHQTIEEGLGAGRIEFYRNTPVSKFSLPGFSHHWLIVQMGDAPSAFEIESGKSKVSYDGLLSQDHFIYVPPFVETGWEFSEAEGSIHLMVPDQSLFESGLSLVDIEKLRFGGNAWVEKSKELCDHVRTLLCYETGVGKAEGADLQRKVCDSFELLNDVMLEVRDCVPPTANGLTMEQLQDLENYIYENLGTVLSLESLAEVVGYSQSHFSKMFKECMGVTPYTHLTNLRLTKARELIANGYDMAEIALLCGFSDQAHFSRVFKSKTGFAPSHFKKVTKNEE